MANPGEFDVEDFLNTQAKSDSAMVEDLIGPGSKPEGKPKTKPAATRARPKERPAATTNKETDFDPDAFLDSFGKTEEPQKTTAFDPDAFLASPSPKEQAEKAKLDQAARDAEARKPAQMPANARPGDSGLLPEPEPFSWGGAARAVGQQFVNEAKAVPAAFNDAVSMGAIPAIQEREGGSLPPGTYQRTMEAGPVGTIIGQTGGLIASGGTGLAKPLAQGGQMLASGLRRAGAFASPTVERAVASGVASGGYGAMDAAVRGGSPEQVFDAAMTGATMGAAIPIAAKAGSSAVGVVNKIGDKSVASAEKAGVDKLIDQATWGKVNKGASQLEKRAGVDATLDPETRSKDAVLATAKKHGLRTELVSQSVPRIADAVEAKRVAAGAKVGEYIKKAADFTPGVRLDALEDSIRAAQKQHAVASQEYKALENQIESLRAAYGETNVVSGVPRVPLWEVHDMAKKAAEQGYSGVGQSFTDPTATKRLGRQVAKAIREPLYDEINRVAARNPSSVGKPEGFAKARADFADLSALSEIAESARPKTTTGKNGLFGRMDAWDNIKRAGQGSALLFASNAVGLPRGVQAALAATPYIKPVMKASNAEMAKLINAARSGLPADAYQAAAQNLGFDSDIAARVWQQFGSPAVGLGSSQEASRQEP